MAVYERYEIVTRYQNRTEATGSLGAGSDKFTGSFIAYAAFDFSEAAGFALAEPSPIPYAMCTPGTTFSGYRVFLDGTGSVQRVAMRTATVVSVSSRTVYYNFEDALAAQCDVVKAKGDYVDSVEGEAGQYPENGPMDGYWYVLAGAPPALFAQADGAWRRVAPHARQDGVWRPLGGASVKI